ncbi:FUSC family protein [Chromohalobacter canadensis]|uniref:FUSC family protein n=1 Tax=Chromohalobacter canadensis TaxID=141389 RepID=UPI0021C128D0|nr:FUSC family protein [Chromohalobacter canadensis]MCT8468897.1 FUSC family protein [Chromohalobacter canadensis]MCT8472913.1 FUSC family protein [Chromohalobacter canadensis]MCT8500365.1 FUSC family protein [Chromohalobacter canadensis]
MLRISTDHWLLALRTVLAVWLALFLSLRLDLYQPAWAILAVMIVTLQPVMFTGGTPPIGIIIGRSIARFFGTLFGAVAGLVLIALFGQQPMLYLLFAGAWLAFCMYWVMLEQDEYWGYVMMLSGYTATLVSLTALGTGVDDIWTIAQARFTETALGIGCGLLMHVLIAPRFGSRDLPGALSTLLSDAADDTLAALDAQRPHETRAQHLKALLSRHQRFEKSRGLTRLETRRLSHFIPALDRFASDSLALITAIRELEVALDYLRECDDGDHWLAHLREDSVAWLRAVAQHREATPEGRPTLTPFAWDTHAVAPRSRVRAELVRQRLGEVLGLLQHGRQLRHALEKPASSRVHSLPRRRRSRATHNEHFVARYNALRVFVAFVLLGQFWIHSGWQSGYLAMMLLGVFTMLFAKAPNPAAVVYQFLWGTLAAVTLGGILLFLIFPIISGFPLLAIAIGIPVMIGTLLTTRPRWAAMGLSGAVTLMTLLNLHSTYTFSPATYINGGVASIIGTTTAMLTYSLMRQRSPAERIRTLMGAYWQGLARLMRETSLPNRARLESRLYDRLGRIVALGGSDDNVREAVDLHALALCVWRIRRLREALGPHRADIEDWLDDIGARLTAHQHHAPAVWEQLSDQARAWVDTLYHEPKIPVATVGEMAMLGHLMRTAPGAGLEAQKDTSTPPTDTHREEAPHAG